MGSPYQQRAFQRKVIYLGAILVLFTGSWAWRHYFVEEKADQLAIREINRGDVELSGSLLRLSLTGMRGPFTCYGWMTAIDQQKKNQWNKLELTVRTITKMQPHFVTPWLFQSWNLSYNVSVELDRTSDKYFYIARGIELLTEGERQNHYNPDLRWMVGFTYQHKICQHDETNVLRSLFQLSMIPPNERDPARFVKVSPEGKRDINYPEFEAFCKEHPQLVRRLHDGIQRETSREQKRQFRCQTPEAVVQFLDDNYKIASLYEEVEAAPRGGWKKASENRLRDETDRFPLLPLPPGRRQRPAPGDSVDDKALDSSSTLNDGHDAYAVARAWYSYAVETLPPPGELPGENQPITDPVRQRKPKMTTLIFRHYPARGQSYIAERLQQEGWFDEDGWDIPDWFEEFGDKFSDRTTPARVGTNQGKLSQNAWEEAYQMWRKHGVSNHLLFDSPADEQNTKELAEAFRAAYGLNENADAPRLREEDLSEDLRRKYRAFRFLREYTIYRQVSNFGHHYLRSNIESKAETVQARKLFYLADARRLSAAPVEDVLRIYEQPDAIPAWRDKVLLAEGHEQFRRDSFIQEETYEIQLKYLDLVNEDLKSKLAHLAPLLPLVPKTASGTFGGSVVKGPFDILDDEKEPLIPDRVRETVDSRRGKTTAKPQSAPPK